MRRLAGLTFAAGLLLAATSPVSLVAQQPVPMPTPDGAPPKLDPLHQRLHDVLIAARDSIQTVSAASAALRRDVSLAANVTVTSRASRLVARCGVGIAAVRHADSAVASTPLTGRAKTAAQKFAQAGDALRNALETHCLRGLAAQGPGVRADTLRAWTPYHTARLDRAINAYQEAGSRLANDAGIRLEPHLPH